MCIKTPKNTHFSLLNEARPKPCSRPVDPNLNRATSISMPEQKHRSESPSPMQRPYASKFDKAIRVYILHSSEKSARKALKKATSQEETPPCPQSIHPLLACGLSVSLVKEIQKLPLEYKPSHLETTASIHSELGNSIHNSSSVARRSVDLYGVRVFKACVVVHEMLRNVSEVRKGEGEGEGVRKGVDEGVREELGWWFDVLGHDLRLDGGERGYGHLLDFYITYLKALLASLSEKSRPLSTRTILSTHQVLSLSNHTLRESLLASITSSPPSTSGAKIAALRLVLLDAMAFPAVHERLLGLMGRDGVCEAVVLERERVFEIRREEVVGFVGRCEGLGLELELDSEAEGKDNDADELGRGVGELRV